MKCEKSLRANNVGDGLATLADGKAHADSNGGTGSTNVVCYSPKSRLQAAVETGSTLQVWTSALVRFCIHGWVLPV